MTKPNYLFVYLFVQNKNIVIQYYTFGKRCQEDLRAGATLGEN